MSQLHPKSSSIIANQRAFTLIELLTVIAIIGILASIIIPTVGKVRKSAQAASCVSNLRQIGAAMYLYANANGDRLPYAQIPAAEESIWNKQMWQWQLQPYLESKQNQDAAKDAVFGGIFRCPGKTNYKIDGNSNEQNSYTMNAFSDGGNTIGQRTLTSLSQPTITLLVSDNNANDYYLRNSDYLYKNNFPALWHSNKNNMLFADGHVEALPTNGVNYYLMKWADDSLRP